MAELIPDEPKYTFLSWDCAYRSLAWSYVTIYPCRLEAAEMILRDPHHTADELRAAKYLMDHFIVVHDIGAADIIGCKLAEVSELTRALALGKWLAQSSLGQISDHGCTVLIEHQPTTISFKGGRHNNNKSPCIAHQLAIYYQGCNIIFMSPKMKDALACTEELSISKFGKTYAARKKHSVANFKHIAGVIGMDITQLPRAMLDDIADSFLQMIAYYVQLVNTEKSARR